MAKYCLYPSCILMCSVCTVYTGHLDLEPKHPTKTHSQATLLHILSFPLQKKTSLHTYLVPIKSPQLRNKAIIFFSRQSCSWAAWMKSANSQHFAFISKIISHNFTYEHWRSWWIPDPRTKKTLFCRGDFARYWNMYFVYGNTIYTLRVIIINAMNCIFGAHKSWAGILNVTLDHLCLYPYVTPPLRCPPMLDWYLYATSWLRCPCTDTALVSPLVNARF